MSTPFSFEYVFRAPSVASIIEAYFHPDHLANQDQLAELGDRVVVDSSDTDAVRKCTWRVRSTRPLPMIARPFAPGGLKFLETMTWQKSDNGVEMTVVPEILGGRVQIAGTYQLTPIGDGKVRRIYKGTITAAIKLLSGKIERGILDGFSEGMPAMAACTQAWLDRKHAAVEDTRERPDA
jgi:hypothetical protein